MEFTPTKMDLDSNFKQQVFVGKITDLPTEILIKIFEYLGFEDLKSASCECRQWFNITSIDTLLMKYPLVLHGNLRLNEPPLSVFLNSIKRHPDPKVKGFLTKNEVRGFQHIKFKLDKNYHIDEMDHLHYIFFMIKYGKFVKRLDLININSTYLPRIVRRFPYLQTLSVDSLECVEAMETLPSTIETLIVKKVDAFDTTACIDDLLEESKNLKHLIFKKTRMLFEDGEPKHIVIRIKDWEPKYITSRKITCSESLNNFALRFGSINLYFQNLNVAERTEIDTKDVYKISIEGSNDNRFDLYALADLPNLRTLVIYELGNPCMEFHQQIVMPTVKKFILAVRTDVCQFCFKTIIDSFPNLAALTVFKGAITNDFMTILSDNCKNLKSLHVDVHADVERYDTLIPVGLLQLEEIEINIIMSVRIEDLSLSSGYNPNMKKFTFYVEDEIYPARPFLNFNNFPRQWPNLISLTIDLKLISLEAAEVILKGWPKLTYFSICLRGDNESFLELFHPSFVRLITQYSKYLESFHYFVLNLNEIPD